MIFKSLEIKRQLYGDFEGQVRGKIVFEAEAGEISLILDAEHCERIFDVCADALVAVAKDAAVNLTRIVFEHKAAPKLEDKP